MREIKTIDGWIDADYLPAKRLARRPRNSPVLAARWLRLAEFIIYDVAQHGVLESSLNAAMKKFHCSRSHALAVLKKYRRDLPVAISIYVGPQGSRAVYRVQGSDGRSREIPNARISCLSTYEDPAFVADDVSDVPSMPSHPIPGGQHGGSREALPAAGGGAGTGPGAVEDNVVALDQREQVPEADEDRREHHRVPAQGRRRLAR